MTVPRPGALINRRRTRGVAEREPGHYRIMRERDPRAEWATHFARTVAEEIRAGIRSGVLTAGEAEELLARMQVLVDQALDRSPLPV